MREPLRVASKPLDNRIAKECDSPHRGRKNAIGICGKGAMMGQGAAPNEMGAGITANPH